VPDGGCAASGCAESVPGDYRTCVTCPPPVGGPFGPFTTSVSYTCGCEISACVGADGGECGSGCVSPTGMITVTVEYMGMSFTCSGEYMEGGTTTLGCPPCVVTWTRGDGGTCP
jgi:hypothetical protein